MTNATEEPEKSFMGLVRTRLAFERTLMAWVRTAVSLITFGFTLDKAQSYLHAGGAKRGSPQAFLGLREFATVSIALGLVALVLATLLHYRHVKTLHAMSRELPIVSVAVIVAVVFLILGGVSLVDILVRW